MTYLLGAFVCDISILGVVATQLFITISLNLLRLSLPFIFLFKLLLELNSTVNTVENSSHNMKHTNMLCLFILINFKEHILKKKGWFFETKNVCRVNKKNCLKKSILNKNFSHISLQKLTTKDVITSVICIRLVHFGHE